MTPEAEEEEEGGTFLYHNTPPPHVPSARLICVNYQLNAGNRIQTSNSNFLLNFCVTLLVFVAGVGEARVVPSPWPGHPIKGTGPLCLRGPPPWLLLYLIHLLLYLLLFLSRARFIKAGNPRGAAAGAETALPETGRELQEEQLKPKIPNLLLGTPRCHHSAGPTTQGHVCFGCC